MIRAVLDTNTIISALFWAGAPAKVYSAANKREFVVITSEGLVNELSNVLSRDKFGSALAAKQTTANLLVTEYRELAEIVESGAIPADIVRDPKDRIELECAIGGKATLIVSGDKDLLVLGNYGDIPILTANQFLERLFAR